MWCDSCGVVDLSLDDMNEEKASCQDDINLISEFIHKNKIYAKCNGDEKEKIDNAISRMKRKNKKGEKYEKI